MSDIPRWRRVIRAAGRLAALYVVATLILLLAAAFVMEGILPTLNEVLGLWTPFGVAFLIAFLLLASARRAGLVALWVILLGLWLYIWRDDPAWRLPTSFMAWTVFALPLYGLGMIGAPSTTRLLRTSSLVSGIIWICLVGAAVAFANAIGRPFLHPPAQTFELLHQIGRVTWLPFPFLLCLHEIVRVRSATAETSVVAA